MKSRRKPKTFSKLAWTLILVTCGTAIAISALFGWAKEMNTSSLNTLKSTFQLEKPVQAKEEVKELTQKQMILNYIVEVFGDESANAITIINKCENHNFDPKAQNWNSNGSVDTGIFMVNSVHGYSEEQLKDWKFNIDKAKQIYDRNGWSAWACSHVIGVKSFWQ